MTNVRIKVKVTDLIDLIVAKKHKAEETARRDNEKFQSELREYKRKMIRWLETLTEESQYAKQPPRPYCARRDVSRFDRDIALLRMSADEVITVTANSDFYRYLV